MHNNNYNIFGDPYWIFNDIEEEQNDIIESHGTFHWMLTDKLATNLKLGAAGIDPTIPIKLATRWYAIF